MRNDTVVTVRRSDYRAPAFVIERVELDFDLDSTQTTVTSRFTVRPDPGAPADASFWLDGEDLEFVELTIDGRPPAAQDIEMHENGIALRMLRAPFTVRIVNQIRPAANTELMGLYVSNGRLFTQCEAEGFRRITFFPDRPDVMTRYRVTLRADREQFPVLLANGNLVGQAELPDGRHAATWDDPYAKPSYLFALVAGRFVVHEEPWRRASGRDALLQGGVDGPLQVAGYVGGAVEHVGVVAAGGEVVDPDAQRRPFRRHHPGQGVQCGLGGGVEALVRGGLQPPDRYDVDDGTAPVPGHPRG